MDSNNKKETEEKEVKTKKPSIHKRIYNWMLSWADSKYGGLALFIFAFAESSFFPIPPDILLIALVLGSSKKWIKFASICLAGSVVGGMFGYFIGYAAWNTVGIWILENVVHINFVEVDSRLDIMLPAYLTSNFSSVLGGDYLFQVYDKWNAWIVFVFGLTPLPYKLVTITAGAASVNIPIFLLSSALSRSIRFFMVAFILKVWGPPAKVFIDKYFNLLCIAFTVLLIAGFVGIYWAFK